MITALMFAAVGRAQPYSLQRGFVPYGSGPGIGYSSPAFLSVASGAAYAVTAKATNIDIWKRVDSPNDLQMFNYPAEIQIAGSFGSGSILNRESWVYQNSSDPLSHTWSTWSIKAPEVGGDETLITYDCFIAKDTVSGVRHDADTPRFTTVVQVNGSDSRGESGQSR